MILHCVASLDLPTNHGVALMLGNMLPRALILVLVQKWEALTAVNGGWVASSLEAAHFREVAAVQLLAMVVVAGVVGALAAWF
jgi:hypothetical protein